MPGKHCVQVTRGGQAVATSGQISVMVEELSSRARQSELGPHLDKTLQLRDPCQDLVTECKNYFLFKCHLQLLLINLAEMSTCHAICSIDCTQDISWFMSRLDTRACAMSVVD